MPRHHQRDTYLHPAGHPYLSARHSLVTEWGNPNSLCVSRHLPHATMGPKSSICSLACAWEMLHTLRCSDSGDSVVRWDWVLTDSFSSVHDVLQNHPPVETEDLSLDKGLSWRELRLWHPEPCHSRVLELIISGGHLEAVDREIDTSPPPAVHFVISTYQNSA